MATYESELTGFLRTLKQQHPELERSRRGPRPLVGPNIGSGRLGALAAGRPQADFLRVRDSTGKPKE